MAGSGHASLLKLQRGLCLRCGNPRRSGEEGWCRACASKVRQRAAERSRPLPTGKRAAAYLAALFAWASSDDEAA